MPGPVLFYVQHLLGIGHLKRASLIVRAMAGEGMEVHLVSGGMAVEGLDFGLGIFHQLAPLKTGEGGFSDLREKNGQRVDEDWKAQRRNRLLGLFHDISPACVITEAFPFGRRQMRFELLPLLDAARKAKRAPLILCSLRDVLQTGRKPGRDEETAATLNEYYKGVLVHGDPSLYRLEDTFPRTSEIIEKIHYTGIVTDRIQPRWGGDSGEVLVHAGGGAVGEKLLRTALESRPLTSLKNALWRLITGPNLNQGSFDGLCSLAPGGVKVERFCKDLPRRLAGAVVSVSQGGYNTVAEILHAGNPAVIVPYGGAKETEQAFRARSLANRGVLRMITEDQLTPASLAWEIDRAVNEAGGLGPGKSGIDLDGAVKTAKIVAGML